MGASNGHGCGVTRALHVHRHVRLRGGRLGRDAFFGGLVGLGREVGKEGRDRRGHQLARLIGAGVEISTNRMHGCGGIDTPTTLGHSTRIFLRDDRCSVVGARRVRVPNAFKPWGGREVDVGRKHHDP